MWVFCILEAGCEMGVNFQERVWSLVSLLVEKTQGNFFTEKESWQILAEFEQLGKLLPNHHFGPASTVPLNYKFTVVRLMKGSTFDNQTYLRSSCLQQMEKLSWSIQIQSDELNWVKCQSYHEPNSHNLARLVWSTMFDPGLKPWPRW